MVDPTSAPACQHKNSLVPSPERQGRYRCTKCRVYLYKRNGEFHAYACLALVRDSNGRQSRSCKNPATMIDAIRQDQRCDEHLPKPRIDQELEDYMRQVKQDEKKLADYMREHQRVCKEALEAAQVQELRNVKSDEHACSGVVIW